MTMEKGEAKVVRAMREALERVTDWLAGKPTGQFNAKVEIHANQGGVGDVFIEVRERERV